MSASNGELIVSGQQRDLMIQAASLAVIVVMIFNCGVAIAGPNQPSADYIMPGCRDAASLITFSNIGESEEEVARLNFCKGIVVGLSFMGEPYGICVPPGTTSQQAASIVVQYIDGQPARIDEDFGSFAVEALRANWPCREPLPVALH
jgi:Rap1a immunity proteins